MKRPSIFYVRFKETLCLKVKCKLCYVFSTSLTKRLLCVNAYGFLRIMQVFVMGIYALVPIFGVHFLTFLIKEKSESNLLFLF